MGLTHAEIIVENSFNQRRLQARARVDTGAVYLTITDGMARELGFDITEVGERVILLADGTRRTVPMVGPIRLRYAHRFCDVSALVFGEEALMGVVPLEMMDLVVHPVSKELTVNPASPDLPSARA